MKKIALAAALSLSATTAFAGGMAEPQMEPEVVKASTSSSSSTDGYLVPVLAVLALVAVAAN